MVMKARICRAISSPTPTRPTGRLAAVLASMSRRAASGIAARIGVSMIPGETQLTRTGAKSSARLRVSDSSAPLAAPTMAEFGRGRMLRKPETNVSDPTGRICAERATRQAPQNLPSMVPRTSSSATVLNGPLLSCAAVTTTWSSGPQARNSSSTLLSSVTSAGIALAPIVPATEFSRSALREAMMTSAPSRVASSAVDRPIPEEPPTTTTFLPTSIMLSSRSHLLLTYWCARSGRLVAHADPGLALSEPRQFPDAGAAWIDVGSDIDVDQIGLVGGDALAKGLAEIAGPIDPHALYAAGARHRGEVRTVTRAGVGVVEIGRQFAAAEIAALQAADRGVGVIVPDHPDHRQIIFNRRAEHIGVHEERAIAADGDAGPIGRGKFRAHHAGDAKAHRTETHRADQRIRPLRLAEAQEPIVMHADIADQD